MGRVSGLGGREAVKRREEGGSEGTNDSGCNGERVVG